MGINQGLEKNTEISSSGRAQWLIPKKTITQKRGLQTRETQGVF